MIAVGVASPMAHGQAMTTTVMNAASARVSFGSGPSSHQSANVSAPTARTAGTKIALIWSARRWIGAFEPCARRTSSTIWASAVSLPTRVARITKLPVVLRVAPITSSPGRFVTGIASPVSIASSSALLPSMSTPSVGTFSPGRTRRRSPGRTWSIGTSTSPASVSSRAVFAWSPMRRLIAPVVRPFARASSHFPRRIRPMMIADESKYVSPDRPARMMISGYMVTKTL